MAGAYVTSSGVHTTGLSGTIGSSSSGDLLVIMATGESGHSTATGWVERGYVADANSGFKTLTLLTKISTGGTTAVTLGGAGKMFDGMAFSGESDPSSVAPTSGSFAGDPGTANITPALATPTGTVTLVIAWANTADNFAGVWSQGSGGNAIAGSITTLFDSSATETNASGYQVGIAAGTYNPGAVCTGGSRTIVLVGFFQEAGGGGATRPVKMAGEWGGYAGPSGGFAGRSRHGLHIPSRYGNEARL